MEITINDKKYPVKWSYGVILKYIKQQDCEYVDEAYQPMIDWLNGGRLKTSTLFNVPKLVKLMIEEAGGEITEDDDLICQDIINSIENAGVIADAIEKATPQQDKKKAEQKSE